MDVRTLQNYKLLADMIPELSDLVETGIVTKKVKERMINIETNCSIKIKSIEANRVYQVNNGYTYKDSNGKIHDCKLTFGEAVINDGIFLRYMRKHGVKVKHGSSQDFIVMKFDYNVPADDEHEDAISTAELRTMFYRDGCEITYNTYDKNTGDVVYSKTIKYCMLYRTPGKAKEGSCIFIKEELLNKARNYLTMDLYDRMPDEGAKIVEMSAYSTLITASAADYIHIPLENILIVEDKKVSTELPALAVRINDEKRCYVEELEKYPIENILWDGMGLIDDSIFPEDMEGFIYCRSHFFKSCLFRGNLQQYFKDYYKIEYGAATVTDMFGNEMKVSDVKVIITDNSIKWLKFKDLMGKTDKLAYKYYRRFMKKDGEQFAIVKTAHKSKYGNLQRSSYQINNSLPTTDPEVLRRIAQASIDYYDSMVKNTDAFINHLRMNKSCYSIDRVLVALYEHNSDIQYTSFFKDEKSDILCKFKRKRLMLGKLLQVGDNLTICGNPISLLMLVTGQDYLQERCFTSRRDGIECYTTRFADGECLAGFRSPHNSPNNIVHLINKYSEPIQKYFPKLGENVIIINGIGTDVQARLNGQDLDSDCCFVTNQLDIVALSQKAYMEYPTIVNEIPLKGTSVYNKDMESYALMDNMIASGQDDVGSSSNIAQLALSYYFDLQYHTGEYSKELRNIFVICCVLAQVAIDSAKRSFNVSVSDELRRLKKIAQGINIDNNELCGRKEDVKYPTFYAEIQCEKQKKKVEKLKRQNKRNKEIAEISGSEYKEELLSIMDKSKRAIYICPMELLSNYMNSGVLDPRVNKDYQRKTINIRDIFKFPTPDMKKAKNYRLVIERAKKYDKAISKLDAEEKNYPEMASCTFEDFLKKIQRVKIDQSLMRFLIAAAFNGESHMQNRLLEMLFGYDKELFLLCFFGKK